MMPDVCPPQLSAMPSDGAEPVELLADDDRLTLVPRDADGVERMSVWITADREDFYELAEWR